MKASRVINANDIKFIAKSCDQTVTSGLVKFFDEQPFKSLFPDVSNVVECIESCRGLLLGNEEQKK